MKRVIKIEIEVDRPFDNAEQERYVLASIESALEGEIWHDMLANEATAPQRFSKVSAHFTK